MPLPGVGGRATGIPQRIAVYLERRNAHSPWKGTHDEFTGHDILESGRRKWCEILSQTREDGLHSLVQYTKKKKKKKKIKI
jgi:hypothetical protein